MRLPPTLTTLMTLLKRLPGVGQRTAERYAFVLLQWNEEQLQQLAHSLQSLRRSLTTCSLCGALSEHASCTICLDPQRDRRFLCVVAQPRDIFAFEETRSFHGTYHVLGGVLSPLSQKTPESLRIATLKERVQSQGIQEVILALDTTLEGDATSLFLKRELEGLGCHVSRLAFGLPMGSSLEYVDGGTLSRALSGRQQWI